ncbi:OmpA/MotB family protein [Flavihumibacter fluvii]|uniref:OmpA/MotB family protein n=1 Tax=Flavihumibacter fluvii TaxID=2838157 RepID=UPI001BDE3EE6|nr:OmpA family protein [Flavihumibacter fluvii]ULQ53764.1 OmpA family protein [Flavihumibacter fluvii]
MRAATSTIDSLRTEVSTLNTKVAENDKEITQLKAENVQYSKEAADCRAAKEAAAAASESMKKEMETKEAAIDELILKAQASKQKLVDAGAEVNFEDGLVYISMPEKFKFKNGSSNLSAKGKEGLKAIAEVLNEYPDAKAIIVGNTDANGIKGADNWSLSTERANAVVRILTDKHKIDPARLTAAGRGKYHPLGDNKTKAGREQNRRFEVILEPDMSKLWDILEN